MINKIFAITSSRSDFGILKPLLNEIERDKKLDLTLNITGSHFSKLFGSTHKEISKSNFKKIVKNKINYKISDLSKSLKLLNIFKNNLIKSKPDLLIILGDRFEILIAAYCAFMLKIKIAHIHGGEKTKGSLDDQIRHCISKLSNYHFVVHDNYKKRLVQLGENSTNIFNYGSLSSEAITKIKMLSKNEVLKKNNISDFKDFVLISYHPLGISPLEEKKKVSVLLKTLSQFKKLRFIITSPNSDQNFEIINKEIKKITKLNKNFVFIKSLGWDSYVNLMKYSKFNIGNSSSLILESPSLKSPSILLDNRQDGRYLAKNIILCKCSYNDIKKSIYRVTGSKFLGKIKKMESPFFKKNTKRNILKEIKKINKNFDFKSFVDLKLPRKSK